MTRDAGPLGTSPLVPSSPPWAFIVYKHFAKILSDERTVPFLEINHEKDGNGGFRQVETIKI